MKYTYRIKQNYEFRRLYRRGQSAATPFLVVYAMKTRRKVNRIGLTVSPSWGALWCATASSACCARRTVCMNTKS